MCNLPSNMETASSSSVKLFRPWDESKNKKGNSDKDKKSDLKTSNVNHLNETEKCQKQSERSISHAADVIYAELSQAELARLGLVCSAEIARLKARKQRPKKFHCPSCNVAFSNNGQLRGHIRIHTGERPFKCTHEGCGKAFTRNEELTRHSRIHTGLRPYPCLTCGKRFGRKDHLKKHGRTHQRGLLSNNSATSSSNASLVQAAAAAAALNAAVHAAGTFFPSNPIDPLNFLPPLMQSTYPGLYSF